MGVKVTNNAYGTLSASISTSDTTITLDSGQGARFPSLGAGDYFYGTLVDTSNNIEVVKVTARSTDSMTVTRGADNTTATAFAIGDRFELRPTAALFEDIVSGATVVSDTTPQLGGDLDTNGNDVNFGDGDKAQFGAGNDLQIYHDTTNNHSFIDETGTGDFRIRGDNLSLRSTSTDEPYINATTNGAVSLYYDNTKKFETTSDGILNSGQASDHRGNGTGNRCYEFFDTASLSTTAATLFTATTENTHIGLYYEIIFYGGDWSNHSSARTIKRGFVNGYDGYTGHSVVENAGPYANNMNLSVSWSGSAVTFKLALDSGSVGGRYYARLIGSLTAISI